MQLLHVMDIITTSLDHGQPATVAWCYLFGSPKAVDSVPHSRLLCTAESYGISGKFLNWMIKVFNGQRLSPDLLYSIFDLLCF